MNQRIDPTPTFADIYADERFIRLHKLCDPFTMTPVDVQYAFYRAILYIHENKIPGDIAECGVWRGGSMLLAAALLVELGDTTRTLWLYDTFDGMTMPTDEDINLNGVKGDVLWKSKWLRAGLHDVMKTMDLAKYQDGGIRYVVGDILKTAPEHRSPLAILRLDTDFYESTKAELTYLYPHLTARGVLIIDDYGHWNGCKKAVDEAITEMAPNVRPFLQRVNYSARMGIKF